MIALFRMLALVVGAGLDTKIEMRRCADAKSQNPALLSVVAIVSSFTREFDLRAKLRQSQFEHARSINSRTVFRPVVMAAGAISRETRDDSRPVCVQPVFVLSPWHELIKPGAKWSELIRQDEWKKLTAESKEHQDVLIAPTIIDAETRARELMHVLEWSRYTVPWADYIVSVNTSVHIHWPRMIELFPPPAPQNHLSRKLWHLGTSDSGKDALFFKDPRDDEPQECAHMSVAAFSRDLVRQMTSMPFSTQILYALSHPFSMYRARCQVGTSISC